VATARPSGKEDALVFAHLPNEDPALKAAEIIQAHLRRAFQIDGLDLMLRTSIGTAWFPRHGRNFEMLLAKADVAMSVARQQGGNRLLVYDDAYGEQLRGDFELQSALATARDRHAQALHHHPHPPRLRPPRRRPEGTGVVSARARQAPYPAARLPEPVGQLAASSTASPKSGTS